MNNKFDELTKSLAQTVSRRQALKKFGVGLALAGMALAVTLPLQVMAGSPSTLTSSVTDSAGDAIFPSDLYDGPVPPYLDVVQATVTITRGVFHFEIKVNADIPANGDPGLTPAVNHLGSIFGILTDRKTAGHYNFFGHQESYYFNFLVGALYSVGDAGAGLGLGWHGFLQASNGFTEIDLVIRGNTFIFETSAQSLGNPPAFDWIVGSECDPVPIQEETNKTTILVDYAPEQGYANWPAQ